MLEIFEVEANRGGKSKSGKPSGSERLALEAMNEALISMNACNVLEVRSIGVWLLRAELISSTKGYIKYISFPSFNSIQNQLLSIWLGA